MKAQRDSPAAMNDAKTARVPKPLTGSTSSHTRLVEVLDALVKRSASDPWGVRELATELNESRSTVNRILVSLVERGLAVEVGAGKYNAGPRTRVLTNALSGKSVLLRDGKCSLDSLADATRSTALISVYCPVGRGYFVASSGEATATLSFRPELGRIYPLSFGDIGRQFAAFLKEERAELIHAPERNALCETGENELQTTAGLLSESEFPSATSIATRRLPNGLLIAVSTHSVRRSVPERNEDAVPSVLQLIYEMGAQIAKLELGSLEPFSGLPDEDTKSTVYRFERLLLLTCVHPEGLKNNTELHEQLLCNGATAKRLVQSAIQAGMVIAQDGILYPGARLYQWAAKLGSHPSDLADLARPILLDLVQETGETIAFLSYDESSRKARYLDVIQGWRPIQYKLQTHIDVPLYAGASGKAVLAYCAPDMMDSIELKKITEATITSYETLSADLKVIRERGWATGDGERVIGAFGCATPFFVDGKVRGSISATIPQYRKEDLDLPRLTELMLEASRKIGRLLSLGDLKKAFERRD